MVPLSPLMYNLYMVVKARRDQQFTVWPTDDMHAARAHRTRAAMHAIAHTMTRTSDSAAHPSSPDQPTAAISNRSHVHARPPRLSVYVCVLVHAPGKQEKTELDS